MKIVISSSGPKITDEVDPRFGRAAYLCIYDTSEKKVVEVIDNTEGVQAAQGAGINAAGLVASKNVETILTGRVGPKAMAVIDKAKINVVSGVTGTVEDAVAAFLGGNSPSSDVKPEKTPDMNTAGADGCRATGGGGRGRGGGGGCGGGGGGGRGSGCRREGQGGA